MANSWEPSSWGAVCSSHLVGDRTEGLHFSHCSVLASEGRPKGNHADPGILQGGNGEKQETQCKRTSPNGQSHCDTGQQVALRLSSLGAWLTAPLTTAYTSLPMEGGRSGKELCFAEVLGTPGMRQGGLKRKTYRGLPNLRDPKMSSSDPSSKLAADHLLCAPELGLRTFRARERTGEVCHPS